MIQTVSSSQKKYYFASDLHLGLPTYNESLKREKRFVKWLDSVKSDAEGIFLLGDMFDFWWEWKRAVPKNFVRFLGKVAEITDSGIPVHYFIGNHDIWAFDYLPKEIGVTLHKTYYETELFGKNFYMTHGDGLGPGDYGYKFLKKIFHNKFLQWCYSRMHPNFGLWIGHAWSLNRRKAEREPVFFGDKEWLIIYSKEILKTKNFDYFIYGHRHLPCIVNLTETSKYINLGDWLSNFTYGEFDGNRFQLKTFQEI